MQARDSTLGEQLLDPRVLANFLEAVWCLGPVDTEQLSPETGVGALGQAT